MASSQLRRDQTQPTYASAPTSASTTTTTMYAPIAERAIPYEQYMSRDSEHIYSTSRVTPRNAPAVSRVASADDAAAQELRQFSREPTVISLSSTVDGDVKTTPGSRSAVGGDKVRSGGDITAGFDSNTLKRMLQTLPELSTPVDLMQEFEEEFADVVGGPSSGSAAAARDDVKPLPALAKPPPVPPPPVTDDEPQPPTSSAVTAAGVSSDQPADASPVTTHADADTSSAEVVTAPDSDGSKQKTEGENEIAEMGDGEQPAVTVQLTDLNVTLTAVTMSGEQSHAGHFPFSTNINALIPVV